MKNLAKSSAVRVNEGEGGGGQRTEENVLKSMRVRRIVNFVMIVVTCLWARSALAGCGAVLWG